MRNLLITLLLVVLSSTTTNVSGQTATYQKQGEPLLINELMQSNVDCKRDNNIKEYPDSWVELYNNSPQTISLKGYKLGTSSKSSKAWSFPNGATIAAKSLLLIYCDKEDAYDLATNRYQTNFRLDSGDKSNVYLFKGTEIVGSVTNMPIQPAPNIAYGRESNGTGKWGYQLTPTPGDNNTGGVCTNDKILGEPVFSVLGKVMISGRFNLTLSLPEGSPSGTEIRYTDNGAEPTSNSPKYSGAITISESKVIRAKLFCTGWLSPRSTTHSYVFLKREMTMPVISISTDMFNLYDKTLGIFANNNSDNRNYHFNWRRPINIEYFESAGKESIINQLCETRVAGGNSRQFPRKSMNIYAHKRFGKKQFEHEFFPDQKPNLKKFKSLVLRNGGNDFEYLYLRDALAQRVMGMNTDIDWAAWRPVIVYINGQYYGLLNLRERAEEDNIWANYNGLEDIDLIENWDDVKEGDDINLKSFTEFYSQSGHTMADYEEKMDCREFMNMMIMNIYNINLDFPGGNIVMWRPRTEGGRWRWIAKDVDYSFGYNSIPYDYNIVEWYYNENYDDWYCWANKSDYTKLFRHLMEDRTFRNQFLELYAIYAGDFLNATAVRNVLDPMFNKINSELSIMRKNISYPYFCDLNTEKNYVNNWIANRTDAFMQQLCSKYGFDYNTLTPLSINKAATSNLDTLIFNGHKLSKNCFNDKYFQNHPIHLSAIPVEGKIVRGWHVVQTNGTSNTSKEYNTGASLTIEKMPSCTKLSIEPIFRLVGDFNDDEEIDNKDINLMVSVIMKGYFTEDKIELYDLTGDKTVNAADLVKLIKIKNSVK